MLGQLSHSLTSFYTATFVNLTFVLAPTGAYIRSPPLVFRFAFGKFPTFALCGVRTTSALFWPLPFFFSPLPAAATAIVATAAAATLVSTPAGVPRRPGLRVRFDVPEDVDNNDDEERRPPVDDNDGRQSSSPAQRRRVRSAPEVHCLASGEPVRPWWMERKRRMR
ncbi:uncharacterized protein C8A04DRAFT_32828 [Dichotomopilus funicola]|uniref:Uncharacterized protein n=1 Tax=Dichotomopilus funicola TaxID=1934379 RepID=A0AAN6ZHT6_9PEZI|nr:hypothetical protein C8A04DRAFT_32828 [Dichotomopilus funicola]